MKNLIVILLLGIGFSINAQYNLKFKIDGLQDTTVYLGVEPGCENMIQAEFPGGQQAMFKFVRDNVRYPEISLELGEQGKIYLQFIIEADGTVSHVKVMRGATKPLDIEGIRLIYSMPQWKAGSCGGKKVRSRAMLPIYFALQ